MLDHFRILNNYNNWANEQIMDAMGEADQMDDRAMALIHHTIAAQEGWLERIDGHSPGGVGFFWPKGSLDDARDKAAATSARMAAYLNTLEDEDDLEDEVNYVNSSGEEFTSTVYDILTHVFNHGTYHRSQINMRLRQTGAEPVAIDYIVYVR